MPREFVRVTRKSLAVQCTALCDPVDPDESLDSEFAPGENFNSEAAEWLYDPGDAGGVAAVRSGCSREG